MPFTQAALFDFDGTLSKRSTIGAFLIESAGVGSLAIQGPWLAPKALSYLSGSTSFSEVFAVSFDRLLRGKTEDEMARAGLVLGARLASRGVWGSVKERLVRHQQEGALVAIVTGGLPYCARGWLVAEGISGVEVFGTPVSFDASGRALGLKSVLVGPHKLSAVEWARSKGAEHISAYGNSLGDREMLLAADAGWWVDKKGTLSPWKGAL